MKIVLVGEEAAGVQVLRALRLRDDEVVAVMARPDQASTLGASLWEVAGAMGLPRWPAHEVRDPDLAQRLRGNDVDVVLNVHSLYLVHPANLDATALGWFNLHPGPLPEYAGLNTVGWALYRGEQAYGVTLHRMAAQVDIGAICYQERFPITEDDTALSLSARCVRVGVPLVLELVDALRHSPASVPRIEQDPAARRLYRRADIPDGGVISWDRRAGSVADSIRAFDYYPLRSPWGHPRAVLAGHEVGVIGAGRTHRATTATPGTVEPSDGGAILVACSDEWIRIRRVHHDDRILDASSILDACSMATRLERA